MTDATTRPREAPEHRTYLIGLVLALVLTAIALIAVGLASGPLVKNIIRVAIPGGF